MIPSHQWLEELSKALWPVLVEHIWQATLIAVLCFLTLPFFRHASTRTRYTLWLVAFMRFAIPSALVLLIAGCLGFKPGINTPIQQVSTVVSQVTQPWTLAIQQSKSNAASPEGHSEMFCLLTLTWITGSLFLFIRWRWQHHRFAVLLKTGKREFGSAILDTIHSLMKDLRMTRCKNLQVVSGDFEPGVWGVWRPVLVLPEQTSEQLDPREVEAILAHELVHVMRWDNLWSNLQMLVCCVFWFHPLVWILDRRLIEEREHSCDERVIRELHNSEAYVSGLIKMTRISLSLQVAGISPMAGTDLKRRIANMNTRNRKAGLSAKILLPFIATLAFFLYLVTVPIHESIALTASPDIKIENRTGAPLEIVSASVADIRIPAQRTNQVTTHLINPKIIVKNNSVRVASAYVLEFRKAGFDPLYLVRSDLNLEPKGIDTIEANKNVGNSFLYPAGPKVPETGSEWIVRLDVVRFKDGNVMTLYPSPIPPPSIASPGHSIVGGIPASEIQKGKGPVSPPPPPTNVRAQPKAVVVDPNQFVTQGSKSSMAGGMTAEQLKAAESSRQQIIMPGVVGGRLTKSISPVPPPLPAPSATPQNELQKSAGKVVSVSIEHSGEPTFDMSRLDGSVFILEGKYAIFQSTPVLTDGGKGKCKFNQPIPVGEYRLIIDIFKISTSISIPNMPQRTINMKLDISKAMAISFQ